MPLSSWLVDAFRGDHAENRYSGWLVVCGQDGHIQYATAGAEQAMTYFRSAAKPFQSYSLIKRRPNLPTEAIALACASHGANDEQLKWVRYLLKLGELAESDLGCGPHEPADPQAQAELKNSGRRPSAIHNNCSGKHAGMLVACRDSYWSTADYLEFHHPLQLEILANLNQWTNGKIIDRAIDGCGAPVFYLTLHAMAQLYAKLATEETFAPLKNAMVQFPQLIGGPGRIDTELMQAAGGRLVAKVGADGVICVGNLQSGEGLTVKITSGHNPIRDVYIIYALKQLGWLTEKEASRPQLEPFTHQTIENTQGKVVGHYQCRWADSRVSISTL